MAGIVTSPVSSQAIVPDGIEFVGSEDTFAIGGNSYTITTQILLGGGPYRLGGTRVYFSSSDNAVINAPTGEFSITDSEGRANFNFTTTDKPGIITITAVANKLTGNVKVTKTFYVGTFADISGMVTDKKYAGIPGASVMLYHTDGVTKGEIVKVLNNPQLTTDMTTGAAGAYKFEKLSPGTYYVEAQKDAKIGYAILNLTAGGSSVNVRIEDYEMPVTGTVTPTAEPEATPQATVTATATPTGEPTSIATATPVPTALGTPTPVPPENADKQVTGILITAAILAVLFISIALIIRSMKK
jgi:hypothetical protein